MFCFFRLFQFTYRKPWWIDFMGYSVNCNCVSSFYNEALTYLAKMIWASYTTPKCNSGDNLFLFAIMLIPFSRSNEDGRPYIKRNSSEIIFHLYLLGSGPWTLNWIAKLGILAHQQETVYEIIKNHYPWFQNLLVSCLHSISMPIL